jgi:hypothetical protein
MKRHAYTSLDLLHFGFGHSLYHGERLYELAEVNMSPTLILSSCRRVVMLTPDTVLIAADF